MADTTLGPLEASFTANSQTSDWLFCPGEVMVNCWDMQASCTIQIQIRHTGASRDAVPQYDMDSDSTTKELNQIIGPFDGHGVYVRAEVTSFGSGTVKVYINKVASAFGGDERANFTDSAA